MREAAEWSDRDRPPRRDLGHGRRPGPGDRGRVAPPSSGRGRRHRGVRARRGDRRGPPAHRDPRERHPLARRRGRRDRRPPAPASRPGRGGRARREAATAPSAASRRRFLVSAAGVGALVVIGGGAGGGAGRPSRRVGLGRRHADPHATRSRPNAAHRGRSRDRRRRAVHDPERRLLSRRHGAGHPRGRCGVVATAHPWHGRARGRADLRGTHRAAHDRARHHPDLRLERGRRQVRREVPAGSASRWPRSSNSPASRPGPTRSCPRPWTGSRSGPRPPSPPTAATRCSRSR